VKANVVAREVLRAFFAAQKVAGVTHPRESAPRDREPTGKPESLASAEE
jgi:hypothetical protein